MDHLAAILLYLLNGLSYGLLLFLLSAGLTLIFSLMGVLNFAHASFYMLGAYLGYALSHALGFGAALLMAPLLVGLLGAAFEWQVLRRVHPMGHVPELLVTFGLSYLILEAVQLVWGRAPLDFRPPSWLQGPAFTLVQTAGEVPTLHAGRAPAAICTGAAVCAPFPATRVFLMGVSIGVWLALWALLVRSRIGLVIRAALTHPEMTECLGHDVPRVLRLVFGVGCALAGLAGVVGGSTFVTEPSMALTIGSLVFVVVVVGGLGSLAGAFVASLLIGLLQTGAVALDRPAAALLAPWGWTPPPAFTTLSLAQVAPVLPYAVLVLVLIWRPRGLGGQRDA